MVLKKIYQKSKGMILGERNIFNILNFPFFNKKNLYYFKSFPRSFLNEIRKFTKRNQIVEFSCDLSTKEQIYCCCPSCLKAHLIKFARSKNLNNEAKILNRLIEGDIGHDGYYIDSENLVKV